jgi:hypothetical protein
MTMSRRYKRREFLVDASFMLASSLLLNVAATARSQDSAAPSTMQASSTQGDLNPPHG